ncbi:uncharacterized protein LOC105027458 isoform X2 [Esox lucius]|uniref:uncharacterized protein LOC105027458 isoform X2 n=1 Tax=Esox lucius TaxID=8010 RepID=UPI00147726A2|nr:uncharacterized protein LOC105027458 isoform X2 [Esox lucius]
MEREDKPSLLLSFHTEVKQESLDADCDSGAQCSLVDSEMMSVKLEDKSQPLGLNDIKYEEEEKIGDFINQETTSVKQEDFSQTLGLNVIIKDEEEEEEIGDSTNHVSCGDMPCKMQPNAAKILLAKELEKKKWTILDNYKDISSPDNVLFYGTNYLLLTSTPDSTRLPVTPDSTRLPVTPDSTRLPVTPDSTFAPVTPDSTLPPVTPDSTFAPDPEYLNLAPLTAPEPALAQVTVPELAPPPEPTHKPPIREPCGPKCRRKCSEKFSVDRRREIWDKYWDRPYTEKRSFMFYSVSQVPTAKVCGDGKSSRRGRSFIYRLKDEFQVPQQVCKHFFLATLGYHPTNDSLVLSVMGKDITTPSVPPKDQRGRHAPANKLDPKPLHHHIESFHPTISHNQSEHAPCRRYLPSDISIKLMYNDYVEKGNNCSYESYRKAVKSKNISFTKCDGSTPQH